MTDGTTLLPNGWRIQPAGKHLRVGDMPLNLIQTPDSRYLIVTSNGLARPSFSVIDIANWSVKGTMALDHAWLGLAWHPDGTRLYSSGAGQNNVQEFNYADGGGEPSEARRQGVDIREVHFIFSFSQDGQISTFADLIKLAALEELHSI